MLLLSLLLLVVLAASTVFVGLDEPEEVDGFAVSEIEDGEPDSLLASLLSLLLFILYALLAASLAGGVGGGLLFLPFELDEGDADAVAVGGVLCRLRCASTVKLGLPSSLFVLAVGCGCSLFSRLCPVVSAPSIDESIL